MTILDRYVLTKFIVPFIYCILGFLAIWLIFDLSDNLQDFIEGKASFEVLLAFYKSQIPEIIVLCLPIALLLALLYSLTAMSRSNEIISMLGAGRSVVRILVPLLGFGLFLTGVTMFFNYESAPHAAAIKKQMLRDIKRGKRLEPGLEAHLFRDRQNLRTWYMMRIWPGQQRLKEVQIIQQDAEDDIVAMWYAREAVYNEKEKIWILRDCKHVLMDKDGNITDTKYYPELWEKNWSETPWRIASSIQKPEYLSVPELAEYLKNNSDFPPARLAPYETHQYYRWALPWVCLVAVLLAAPMGIVYSRRGILGGVATAIALFFALVFFSSLSIALGKGSRIPPFLAAWGPIVVFFIIGLILVWFRSTNRDLPKFKFPGF